MVDPSLVTKLLEAVPSEEIFQIYFTVLDLMHRDPVSSLEEREAAMREELHRILTDAVQELHASN